MNKCIFITGGTGAIGTALIKQLVCEPDVELQLLIRGESQEHSEQRLASLLTALGPEAAAASDRVSAVQGDVRETHWGIAAEPFAELCRRVTHIIHAAGDVKLNHSLAEARKCAVDSARQAVAFARKCQDHGQFVKLDAVSTVGVAGKTTGLIEERIYAEPREFHNTYEAAKAEAENMLLQECGDSLPLTIHRPSMVVGDSRSGEVSHFQVFYHLSDFLAGLRTEGIVPITGDVRLDLIPSDYVARAIQLASSRTDTAGRIFHLCSGSDGSWTLTQLTDRLRELLEEREVALPPLRRVEAERFHDPEELLAELGPENARFVKSLPFFLAYLEEAQLFDNRNSNAYFAELGLEVPNVAEYLESIMGFYWKSQASASSQPAPAK